MLLLGDYFGKQNDATKFGSIKVTRTSATTVQIAPNNFDFDLNKTITETLRGPLRSRDRLTLVGGLFALGFSTPNAAGGRTSYGPGKPVTVVFDGSTPLPTLPRP